MIPNRILVNIIVTRAKKLISYINLTNLVYEYDSLKLICLNTPGSPTPPPATKAYLIIDRKQSNDDVHWFSMEALVLKKASLKK
jgi:hypothetical protein